MPVIKAILVMLAFGSGSLFAGSNASAATQNSDPEPQPTEVRYLITGQFTIDGLGVAQEDRKRLAEKAIAEGKVLEAQGTPDSLRKALVHYETALENWRALHDRRSEALTLQYIGIVHYFLDLKPKALDFFQQELDIWRAEGDGLQQAQALNNIGVIYGSLGLEQKAMEAYKQALPLRHAARDRKGIATTLDNIGMFYLNAGELQKALDEFSQALAIYRELNESPGIANTLNNIGGVHMTWSDYRKAIDYFNQALELRRTLGHRREEAMALNNIGQSYFFLGDTQKALNYHRLALELRRNLGQRAGEAGSINNIGFAYDALGDKAKALDHYKQALELFRAANDRNGESSTLINIGASYLSNFNDPKTALEYYNRALEIRRALGQSIGQATVLDNIGHLYNSTNEPRKAIDYHRQALEIHRATGHRIGEAVSLNNLGAAYFDLREQKSALDYFNQALAIYRAIGSRGMQAGSLFGLARVERERGNLDAALLRMEESLTLIESLRGTVASQEMRASYLAQKQDYYEFYTDLLVRLHRHDPTKGHDLAALESSERARARSLVELLVEARIDVDRGVPAALKQRERATHGRIAWIQKHLIEAYSEAAPDKTRIATLEKELERLDAERQQLDMEIRQKHPQYADLKYPVPAGLKTIQPLLDDQTVLLEYALGKDNSFLFAVTRDQFIVAPIPAAAQIADRVTTLRQFITSRPQRSMFGKQIEHSRQLYRELIEPAGKLLSGKRKLIIVPSGILHYLPFEVLLSSGEASNLADGAAGSWPYLLKDYAISYVPSAGVLASLRSRSETGAGPRKNFLAFADPIYLNETVTESDLVGSRPRGFFGDERSWKLGRLAESRREVEEIAALYAKDKVSLLLGDQASEENVKTAGRFNDYRYIHFATHGLLNEARPPYSGLILSLNRPTEPRASLRRKPGSGSQAANGVSRATVGNDGPGGTEALPLDRAAGPQSEDGLLQVYEVFNLKLNADLVVLSACETGLGKEVKGEGLVGLTHAFFYAGTPSVIVSLWKVQDRSTADLMVNFYQQLDRSQDKTEALRQAKLKLIQNNRYAHPYYWAPFVLIGEPK